MKASEVIAVLKQFPGCEVVTQSPDEYDEDGEITNYLDNSVLKSKACFESEGVVFIIFDNEEVEVYDV